nr:Protein of unknown function (DUF3300) [uncultured bacterium]
MRSKSFEFRGGRRSLRCLVAILSLTFLASGSPIVLAQETTPQSSPPPEEAPKIPNDQLDSLVAPIALYPDTLLAQTLAASTYPLEIIQLQQWMDKNKNLKGKALADAVAKQPWDPSVQSMAGIPDAVKRLAGNIQWTADLGNAFLAQQQDVMDAVQRMRAKAQGKGALKTSQQQTVKTETVEGNKEVIVIQQPNPEVVYVPSYDPMVVYGPPAYPYYPYSYPGYVPGMGLALGTGIILGAAWANNNWGNCNWGGGDININNNNNFNRNTNINRGQGAGNKWQHRPEHRGGAPYSNRSVANKYGGNSRGGPNGNRPSTRPNTPNRPNQGPANTRPGGGNTNRPGGGNTNRPTNRPTTRPADRGTGGGDRIGNRQVSRTPSARNTSAFSGASGGMNRSSARASYSRGSHSMGGSRGGGFSRGGGARGGGRRR